MENTEERQQAEKIREARRQLLADLIAEDGGAVQAVVATQNGEKHCSRCDEAVLESFDYCPRCGSLLKW